jgi:hypothetical protein
MPRTPLLRNRRYGMPEKQIINLRSNNVMTMNQLEADFQLEMLAIYRRALTEFNYKAARYLGMIRRRGGVGAARKLLEGGPEYESSGLAEIIRRGGIDGIGLSVEALVLKQRFMALFTEAERTVAKERLARLMRSEVV